MQMLDMGWALSIARLIDLTSKDPKRVVRPVSPQIVIRPVLMPKKPRHRRRARQG